MSVHNDSSRPSASELPIPVRRSERINFDVLTGPAESRSDLAGVIPTEGVFSTRFLAGRFNVDERTFRQWVQKYGIAYFKPGQSMYVDVKDLWTSNIPRISPEGR